MFQHAVNPHAAKSASPVGLIRSVVEHRGLILSLTRREIVGRYKGSVIGLTWSFVNPVLMLTIYTFVFSFVFKARWNGGGDSRTEFALILFIGLIVYNLFAECVNRAPTLILANANFVKKVVFPLEILPIVNVCAALFHAAISLVIWALAYLWFNGLPQPTIAAFPLVIAPLIPLILGLSWLLAALGVYLRDIGQVVGLATTVLLFLSPIFYSADALPAQYRFWLHLNPLTLIVEQARAVLYFGQLPDLSALGIYTLLAAGICLIGFTGFQRTRRGFADVV